MARLLHFVNARGEEYVVIETEDALDEEYAEPGYHLENAVDIGVSRAFDAMPTNRPLDA